MLKKLVIAAALAGLLFAVAQHFVPTLASKPPAAALEACEALVQTGSVEQAQKRAKSLGLRSDGGDGVRVTSGCVCSLRFDPQAGSSGVVRCTG